MRDQSRPSRPTYRSIAQNAFLALAISLAFVLGVQRTADVRGTSNAWWSLLPITVVGVACVVRALGRGIYVTPSVLVVRRMFLTYFVPWNTLHDLKFGSGGDAVDASADGHAYQLRLRARPSRGTTLEAAARRAMATEHDPIEPPPKAYPTNGQVWMTHLLLASSAVLVISVLFVEGAVRDRELFRLRAANEVTTTAEVADSHIDEGNSNRGDRTYVDVRFHLGARTIETELHRSGRWTYVEEAPIDIVYDNRHPSDADFASRPRREEDDSDVRTRMVAGTIFVVLGALGCLGFGAIVLANTAKYRSSPGLGQG